VKHRLNTCLKEIKIPLSFHVKDESIEKFIWMDEEILSSSMTDFFYKKPIEYQKSNKSFSEEELF